MLLLSSSAALGAGPAAAQTLSLHDVTVHHRRAEANGVQYRIWVRVPPGQWAEGRRFRTVYLLDADYSFLLARNITQHLAERGDLEPLLLVGIGYVDQDDAPSLTQPAARDAYRRNRSRDYTPWATREGGYGPEFSRVTGGAPRFARFLIGELIPWVESSFPAAAERTIVGHSFGGLFASWMLLEHIEVFQRYLIVSPSLWYAEEALFARFAAQRESLEQRLAQDPPRLFLAVGEREVNQRWNMPELLERFARQLAGLGVPPALRTHRVWADETHNSLFPQALAAGLLRLHGGR